MSALTQISERIAAEAIGKAVADAHLEVQDAAGNVLARLAPGAFSYDPIERTVNFGRTAVVKVERMGDPAKFQVVSKSVGGAALVEGTAGDDPKADLKLPKRLFAGQTISVDGLRYQLRFRRQG